MKSAYRIAATMILLGTGAWGGLASATETFTLVDTPNVTMPASLPADAHPERIHFKSVLPLDERQTLSAAWHAPGLLSEGEVRWLQSQFQRRGDGGGADVENLRVIQTDFIDSPCEGISGDPQNVVLLLWEEPFLNPLGIDIIVDGTILKNVNGLEDGQLPPNGTFITAAELSENGGNLDAGTHVFRIEDGEFGTSSEVTIEILDTQPIADVENVLIEPGPVSTAEECSLVVSWDNICPVPDEYTINVSGLSVGGSFIQPGTAVELVVGGAVPDLYTAEVFGLWTPDEGNPNASYRSCFVPSGDPVEITCDTTACSEPPSNFDVWQLQFDAQDGQNLFLMFWTLPQAYSQGLNLFFDGALFDPDGDGLSFNFVNDGPSEFAGFNGPAGPVTVGLQGICDDGVTTSITEKTITILADSPHQNPLAGNIIVTWDGDTETLKAKWKSADCSSYIYAFHLSDPENEPTLNLMTALSGNETEYSLTNTVDNPILETDLISLQFFTWIDGMVYGSPIFDGIHGEDSEFLIRGICNANGIGTDPQLTDGIYLLNFLFQGGPDPACKEACDTDADGGLGITDAVRIFNFLFLGGIPPSGWLGNDPTCVLIEEGMDCEVTNQECPLE